MSIIGGILMKFRESISKAVAAGILGVMLSAGLAVATPEEASAVSPEYRAVLEHNDSAESGDTRRISAEDAYKRFGRGELENGRFVNNYVRIRYTKTGFTEDPRASSYAYVIRLDIDENASKEVQERQFREQIRQQSADILEAHRAGIFVSPCRNILADNFNYSEVHRIVREEAGIEDYNKNREQRFLSNRVTQSIKNLENRVAAQEPINLIIDGKAVDTDVNPIALDGTTYVPIRFIAEATGAEVEWYPDGNPDDIFSGHRIGTGAPKIEENYEYGGTGRYRLIYNKNTVNCDYAVDGDYYADIIEGTIGSNYTYIYSAETRRAYDSYRLDITSMPVILESEGRHYSFSRSYAGGDVQYLRSGSARSFVVHGRTMVPVRVIAELLGAEVRWDGDTRSVVINSHQEDIALEPLMPNGFDPKFNRLVENRKARQHYLDTQVPARIRYLERLARGEVSAEEHARRKEAIDRFGAVLGVSDADYRGVSPDYDSVYEAVKGADIYWREQLETWPYGHHSIDFSVRELKTK